MAAQGSPPTTVQHPGEDARAWARRESRIKGLFANESHLIAHITKLRTDLESTRLQMRLLAERMARNEIEVLGKDKEKFSELTRTERKAATSLGFKKETWDSGDTPFACTMR